MPKPTLFDVMEATYSDLDSQTEEIAEKLKVPCVKGCANCCYMLATAAGIEGLNIGAFLLRHLKVEELTGALDEMRAMALKTSMPGLTNKTYFNRQVRCAFLTKENTCAIYPVRPAACRFHIVISPKENCSPVALDTITRAVDLRHFEAAIWELDMQVNGGKPIMAPIPIVVLWGMRILLEKTKEPQAKVILPLVLKALEGVPTPDEWMERHGLNVAESTLKGTSRSVPITLQDNR